MMAWSKEVKKILSCGTSLSSSGIDNWALNRNQAMQALDEFEKLKTPVLGGDVFELIDGHPEPNYDNWYCDRQENEELENFILRSIKYSRDYINNYRNRGGRETFFVLVAQD